VDAVVEFEKRKKRPGKSVLCTLTTVLVLRCQTTGNSYHASVVTEVTEALNTHLCLSTSDSSSNDAERALNDESSLSVYTLYNLSIKKPIKC